jgi:probable rRNA maturation factor
MSLAIDVATEGVRIPLARARVAALAEGVLRRERVAAAMLSIAFVSDRRIAALNRRHLGHAGPTDVISFGFAPVGVRGPVVGDVYIAPAVARRNARDHGRSVREELMRLVVHGVLHVVGHDHPEDESRYASPMWRRQERLLRTLGAA